MSLLAKAQTQRCGTFEPGLELAVIHAILTTCSRYALSSGLPSSVEASRSGQVEKFSVKTRD